MLGFTFRIQDRKQLFLRRPKLLEKLLDLPRVNNAIIGGVDEKSRNFDLSEIVTADMAYHVQHQYSYFG